MGLLGLPPVARASPLPSRPFAYCFFYGARGPSPPPSGLLPVSGEKTSSPTYSTRLPSTHAVDHAGKIAPPTEFDIGILFAALRTWYGEKYGYPSYVKAQKASIFFFFLVRT